ncbi:hypothetical protein GCM10027443_28940 [Pontibacter brevis]
MKKILYSGALVLATMSMMACERTESTTASEQKGVVVDRDSVATEYEVTETVVEYDTTKQTRTVTVDEEKENKK